MSRLRQRAQRWLSGGLPVLVGTVMLLGPGIGPRIFLETRDPAPLEAVAITIRPCDLLERHELVDAIGQEIRAYTETSQDGLAACSYQTDSGNFSIALLAGEGLRFTQGEDVTQQDFLRQILESQPAAISVEGVGEGAVLTAEGTVWGHQGDLLVQTSATGLEPQSVRDITGLALRAAADLTG